MKGISMSPALDLLIRAQRAVIDDGEVSCVIGVADGRIVTIGPADARHSAKHMLEFGDDVVVLPGLVDTHVHVNEPGRTEWEGFSSATRAAAAGGVTTILDMPLNSIPATVSVAALEEKRSAARGKCAIDVGFWGGAIPDNIPDLRPLHDAGVFGFKCFLSPSGVEEFPSLTTEELLEHMAVLQQFDGLLLVHAEDEETLRHAPPAHGTSYSAFLASRPPLAETQAIATVIDAARRTGARAHIVHLSHAGALEALAKARCDGVRMTCETCPHYLTFRSDEIPDGATAYKCCPPIRDADNRAALWQGLRDGVIDMVVSDHSPCTADLKHSAAGDFAAAWGGIASLQIGLAATWTQARQRGYQLSDVVDWMARRPADFAGLPTKGRLAVGYDADVAIFDPDAHFTVDTRLLHHKNPVTPYTGRPLQGIVRATFLRGRQVDDDPRGALLRRP